MTWLFYPGYQTMFGSYTDPAAEKVNIVAGETTTRNLSVPYQIPTVGAVAGTVSVIGAPQGDFETGVQACSAPPTATTCNDEQDAYDESNGTYQMALHAGDLVGLGQCARSSATGPPRIRRPHPPAR